MLSVELTDGANSAGENGVDDGGRRRGNVSLQADPRVSSSWNAYAYADNNGVMKTDRSGLEWDYDGACSGSCMNEVIVVTPVDVGPTGPDSGWWGFVNAPIGITWEDPYVPVPHPQPPEEPPARKRERCYKYGTAEECKSCCVRNLHLIDIPRCEEEERQTGKHNPFCWLAIQQIYQTCLLGCSTKDDPRIEGPAQEIPVQGPVYGGGVGVQRELPSTYWGGQMSLAPESNLTGN